MTTRKNTIKTAMNISSSLLVVLIIILSVANFFIPMFYLIEALEYQMIAITSGVYLCFSIVLLITGIIFPEKEKNLSSKERSSIFIIEMIAGILNGKLIISHGMNKKKSIRRQWNAPTILIMGIFLTFINLFTSLLVSDSEALNIDYIKNLIAYPYGQVLLAQFIAWILLIFTSSVWSYIDMKDQIQVPEDVRNLKQDNNKKTVVQCSSCATLIRYDRNDGICPVCGTYNRPSEAFYNENLYKSKKTVFELFKTISIIILIFAAIIIATLIQNYLE